jgi:hypothetical protein
MIDCRWLSGWAHFDAWNLLKFLPDQFVPPTPPVGDWGHPSIDPDLPRAIYAFPRCWVELPKIVDRLNELRRHYRSEGRELKDVYVSTNGDAEWVHRLKKALLEEGWNKVLTTRDLELSWEESGVDGEIGKLLHVHVMLQDS